MQGSDLCAQGFGVIDDGRRGCYDHGRFGFNCRRGGLNLWRGDLTCLFRLLGDDGGRGGCSHGRFDLNRRRGISTSGAATSTSRILVLFGCHDTGCRGRCNHRRFDFNRRRSHLDLRRGDICLDRLLVPCGGHRPPRPLRSRRGDCGRRCGNLRRSDLGDGFGRFGCHNAGRNGYRRD